MNVGEDTRLFAEKMDREDPLSPLRKEFVQEDAGPVYLDGNSLGRLPVRSREAMEDAVGREWGERLIRGWNDGWLRLPSRLGSKIAGLIGAGQGEVIVADSTSVCLFKLVAGYLLGRPREARVVSDVLNFPTDLHVIQGVVEALGRGDRLSLVDSRDGVRVDYGDLEAAIAEGADLVCLTHVAFKSSFMYDMKRVTETARRAGAETIWDLSHSTGAVPVDLGEAGAGMAVGCTYKYLNGGPGSPAFIYVRKDLQEKLALPLRGWFGCEDPFGFSLDHAAAGGMERFLTGTPPILSMKSLDPALDLVLEAGIGAIREKSVALTEFIIFLFDKWLAAAGFELGSPRDPGERGSHVSIRHPEAMRICKALAAPTDAGEARVIPDFRSPDNIRLGVAPMYNSFMDVLLAMSRLRDIVERGTYASFDAEAEGAT